MSDKYQIVFLKAGDGSEAAKQSVAERIATASKTPVAKLLEQIESAPFVYKKGLPEVKANAISAMLNKLGGVTEVSPDGAPLGGGNEFQIESPPASGGGGFDFGAPPADPAGSGGFDFGDPPAGDAPAAPGGASDFSFAPASDSAGASGGFDPFGGDPPAAAPPAGSPPPAASSGGFEFSPESAVVEDIVQAESDMGIENNLDYAESSGSASGQHAPPPIQGNGPATVVCPRCETEVPDADECASCGVLMSKAGSDAAPSRPRGKKKKRKKKTGPLPLVIGVVAIAAAAAVAFFGGFLDPIQLKMDAASNKTLSDYGISVSPPDGAIAIGEITDGNSLVEFEEGFVERGRRIQEEIGRLTELESLEQYEAGREALQSEIEAFNAHPAHAAREAVRDVVGRYFAVKGVGLEANGKVYLYRQALELAPGLDAVPVISAAEIRRQLDEGYETVRVREIDKRADDYADRANVSFEDSFEGVISDRWEDSAEVQFNQGWLLLMGQDRPPSQAPRLLTPEPTGDYIIQVSVSGAPRSGGRAGLIVYESDSNYVAVTRSSGRRRKQQAEIVTARGTGDAEGTEQLATLQIQRSGLDYTFSVWDGRAWQEIDSFRPFDEGARCSIGVIAFGGADGFYLDDFALSVQ